VPRAFLNSPVPPTMAMVTGGTDPECALCTDIAPAGKPVSPMERNQGVIVGNYSHERAAHCERADLSSAAIIQSGWRLRQEAAASLIEQGQRTGLGAIVCERTVASGAKCRMEQPRGLAL
jgi:hypothetical protein